MDANPGATSASGSSCGRPSCRRRDRRPAGLCLGSGGAGPRRYDHSSRERTAPGMTHAEVQGALKPVLGHMTVIPEKQGAAYILRVTDEFIIVVMEGKHGEERVAKVNHLADTGPLWERWRRNWEGRFRDWKWRFR